MTPEMESSSCPEASLVLVITFESALFQNYSGLRERPIILNRFKILTDRKKWIRNCSTVDLFSRPQDDPLKSLQAYRSRPPTHKKSLHWTIMGISQEVSSII